MELSCELHGTVSSCAMILGTISGKVDIKGIVSSESELSGSIKVYNGTAPPDYDGTYEVTPSQETQVLSTKHKRLTKDIVVDPIPNNYGLITWDGAILTVS